MTVLQYIVGCHRPKQELAAENLFLRKQLALFKEREAKPSRVDDATRAALVGLSRACNWREALVVVKPATLIRWHRAGFRQYWKEKSRPGRPVVPNEIRALIRQMASGNPTWGEERIARELLLKLGLRVSPRTVRKYMPEQLRDGPGRGVGNQRWTTFIRNHAEAIVACDFFTVVTATFEVLYVFVVIEHATRRILHVNVTRNPTGDWTPQANGLCERAIGTIRRECLDYLIPLGERHLSRVLSEWVRHYNRARPHSALGPGTPDQTMKSQILLQEDRHKLPDGARVTARPVLGGLQHEYSLQPTA